MSFTTELADCEEELDAYYATYPSDLRAVEQDLHAIGAEHPDWLPCRQKAHGYQLIATRCPVKIFRHFPFYCELDTGKPRTDLGSGGVGGWLHREPFGQALEAQGAAWWAPCETTGLSVGWPVLDDNHHCVGIDNVLRYGFQGIIEIAERRLPTVGMEKEREFLTAAIAGCRAAITVAGRFAAEAERLLAEEKEPQLRRQLAQIAAAARRVPAEPPATFYEALNTLLFLREVMQALEGNGNSVLGHLDRQLFPYYQRDVAAGRLTRESAKELLGYCLAFSDIRFGMRQRGNHYGTNTTVVIGGCDADGAPVFNEVTRLICECYRELHLVDPKLNARLSARHPREYFLLLSELIADGSKALAVFNDDVIIDANVKVGKAPADARLYVAGGCQENLLMNTEVNSRATIYLNLAAVFLMGFFPQEWEWLTARDGFSLTCYADSRTYEEFHAAFLDNLGKVLTAHIAQRNLTEREGWRYHPCPLHSATLDDCLLNATDMMEGGARYNYGSVSLTGIGSLIDSLFAVREAVFTRCMLTLPQLRVLLATDFAGEEALRQMLLRLPKFGQEDDEVHAFAARVFTEAARVSSGHPNTRGGSYEASLFSFRLFTMLGERTGATPDGRRAGAYLSPGMSPSVEALGKQCSIGQLLNCIAPLDLTDYPVVAVLDAKLPVMRDDSPPEILLAVLERFLAVGGSVLQLNYVDPAMLADARVNPAQYPDLAVRVSGYSAYFTRLPEVIQEEIIERTEAVAG